MEALGAVYVLQARPKLRSSPLEMVLGTLSLKKGYEDPLSHRRDWSSRMSACLSAYSEDQY